jgi:hypothetical protein
VDQPAISRQIGVRPIEFAGHGTHCSSQQLLSLCHPPVGCISGRAGYSRGDCLGFVEESVFESLLDSVGLQEILDRKPTSADLTLQQWALDWAIRALPPRKAGDPVVIPDEVHRFQSLAFLILVFACPEGEPDLFYTVAKPLLLRPDSLEEQIVSNPNLGHSE